MESCVLTSVYIVGPNSGSLEREVPYFLDRNVQVWENIFLVVFLWLLLCSHDLSSSFFLYAFGEIQATFASSFFFLDEY